MEARTFLLCFIAPICGFCSAAPSRQGSLVYPQLLEERASHGGPVLKINEDITLNLKKSSVLADEFLLRSYVGDVAKHTYMDGSYLEEDLFHDAEAMASLMVSTDEELQVEGMIGHNMGIMPAPEQQRSSDGHPAHMLYEIQDSPSGLYDDIVHQPVANLNITDRALTQDDIEKAKIIKPELFLLADTTFSSQFKNNEHKLITYCLLSVNAMNLRYLSVSNPAVEFILMGVEILTKKKEEMFLRRGEVELDTVDAYMTVLALPYYVSRTYAEFYRPYDVVYVITGLDMVSSNGKELHRGNKGIAHIGTACGFNRVGIGEDRAYSYGGVHIMSHEIAHIMGCPHDGDRDPSYLRGPGSKNCSFDDGFIMSYKDVNLNYYKFSDCCNRQISLMSRSKIGRCLHEINAKSNPEHKTSRLPGDGITFDKQCRRAFPEVTGTYFVKTEPIVDCQIMCHMPERCANETMLQIKLTDGSKCDRGNQVCINGECQTRRKSYSPDEC